VLILWVPGCAVATWWQVGIAESGDSLGWVYSVMWPSFALFAIVFWWFLVHDDPDTLGRRGLEGVAAAEGDPAGSDAMAHERAAQAEALARAEAEDPELADYNDYLAALARQDHTTSRSGRRSTTPDSAD
jgi:hypothetical protein